MEDVSLDRGLVSAQRADERGGLYGGHTESVFVNVTERTIIPNPSALGTRLVDGGKISCGGYSSGGNFAKADQGLLRCIDVDTGVPIAANAEMHGSEPIAASEHASRVVVSDYRSFWTALWHLVHYYDYDTAIYRRITWDVRTGQEVLSWPVKVQSYPPGVQRVVKQPFKVAISADGQLIGEGGDGAVTLFRIEP